MSQPSKANNRENNFIEKIRSMKKGRNKNQQGQFLVIIVCTVMIIMTIVLLCGLFKSGGSALAKSYTDTYNNEKDDTYTKKYEEYVKEAEEKYRVSNHVTIDIGSLQEVQKLEVLKVSDVELVIENEEDNSYNIVSWLEVPGEGTFVVDLKAGEYIIDEERANVLVKVPCPELTNIHIDYQNVNKILFKNDIFDESYKVGEDKAKEMLDRAEALIEKGFASNQSFYLNAQDAAKRTIEALVKQLNSDVSNLTVNVEFY